jgi:hypothetical protein
MFYKWKPDFGAPFINALRKEALDCRARGFLAQSVSLFVAVAVSPKLFSFRSVRALIIPSLAAIVHTMD